MRRSLISLSIAAALLLIVGGAYIYAYLQLQSDAAHVSDLAKQVTDKNSELEALTHSHAALTNVPTQETAIEQYFISKQEIVPFLEAIQSTGKPLGATVDVLSVSDAVDGKHPRLNLSLTITGSFDGVMRTLGAIENGPYDGVLTNVTIDSSPSNDPKVGGAIWTASAILSLGTQTATSTTTKTP